MSGFLSGAHNKRVRGATLLEVMLVLAIGASILFFSIQQYLSFRRDADTLVVKANVDAIFQAMGFYYRYACYGPAPTGTLVPGALYSITPNPHPAPITTLQDNGFLTKALTPNPIVSPTVGTGGYITQFNLHTVTRSVCIDYPTCTNNQQIGSIITWKAQVAVKLNKASTANQYLNLLAGDCLSSASGANVVNPCSANAPGDYVVWERLPTGSNEGAPSTYWPTTPMVSQFTQMYRLLPQNQVINLGTTPVANQYYLCGN